MNNIRTHRSLLVDRKLTVHLHAPSLWVTGRGSAWWGLFCCKRRMGNGRANPDFYPGNVSSPLGGWFVCPESGPIKDQFWPQAQSDFSPLQRCSIDRSEQMREISTSENRVSCNEPAPGDGNSSGDDVSLEAPIFSPCHPGAQCRDYDRLALMCLDPKESQPECCLTVGRRCK